MNLFSSVRLTIAINVFLVLGIVFVLNSALNYKNYTLEENGNWASAKADLRGLNGVYACLFTKTALSKTASISLHGSDTRSCCITRR